MREAGTIPADGGRAADRRIWLRGRLGTLMPAGMLIYVVVAATGVPEHTRGGGAVAGYAIAALFGCCYVSSAVAIRMDRTSLVWAALAVMTALFVAEVPFAGGQAYFLCAVIVPFAAARAGRRAGQIIAAGVLVCVVLPWAGHSWHGQPGWIQALDVFFTSLVTLGLIEIIDANRALVEARAEVARLASEAERARIGRDLHDLLGHSLTAITVKSALARRLAESAPERSDRAIAAAREIAEVENLSRQALAEVRAAVSGYRDVTLAGELARGRELLRASGVTADLPTATDMVDAAHQELFGWAVREGLTNVARHAHATRCTVVLDPSAVEIRDDGVGGVGGACGSGNGLAGLRERASALGGRVDAGPLSPRGWRLRLSVGPAIDTAIAQAAEPS